MVRRGCRSARPSEARETRFATRLSALLVVGLAVHVVLLLTTRGQVYDMGSIRLTYAGLRADPLHVYRFVNESSSTPRWPYPPGFFPWILAGGRFSDASGVLFDAVMRVPSSLADGGLAWLVQDMLGRRGATERARLTAAGLVVLGPVFVTFSSFHGQIDALAILPALAAVAVWERSAPGVRRALVAGLLIGVGGLVKTVPLVILLALAPTVRSRRELVVLVASAAAPVVVALAPFVLSEPYFVRESLSYRGAPWFGGLSLAAQPLQVVRWYGSAMPPEVSSLARLAADLGGILALPGLLVAAVVLVRRRVAPVTAALVLWLVVYALGGNFFPQYLIWALPFLLVAGHLRWALAIQLIAVPLGVVYLGRQPTAVLAWVYIPPMLALWIGSCGALALLAANAARPSDR